MYNISDKSSAIRELQRYLGKIEKAFTIVPSGVYDAKTRFAIERFQLNNGLRVTGDTDKETFDGIYREYINIMQVEEARDRWRGIIRFPISVGNVGSDVRRVNEAVIALASYYGIHHENTTSPVYTEQTAEAVRALAKIYGINSDGRVLDELTFDRMFKDLGSIEEIKGFG